MLLFISDINSANIVYTPPSENQNRNGIKYKMNKITIRERVNIAYDVVADVSTANTGDTLYLGIGKNTPWANNDTFVPAPVESTTYYNELFKNLIAMKKITQADVSLVVRRNDWTANATYDQYDEDADMYSTERVSNANGTITVSNSAIITGVNTTFLLDFANNSTLQLPGDGISLLPQRREVIGISSNTAMTINLAFSGSFSANTPQRVINTHPIFAKTFYVRNIYDQVFVCLKNNGGAVVTDMPQISIGGQLPSDSYIETADGYYWKYLYTMSSGQKQKFMTREWMPISTSNAVSQSAVSGRLDVITIVNGGTGYNNSSASLSAPILVIRGDGVNANLTARVDSNGTIYAINVLDGGSGYTQATVTANIGTTPGVNANLKPVIGPPGGWGSNVAVALGATTVMMSVNLDDTEAGTIPTVDSLGNFLKYRQICVISNPYDADTGNVAALLNYSLSTVIPVSANAPFAMNDVAYQSPTGLYADATYSGTIVFFDNTLNEVYLNNVTGTFTEQTQLYATTNTSISPYGTVIAFSKQEPSITKFSGDIEYIENRSAVIRYPSQTENIKVIINF